MVRVFVRDGQGGNPVPLVADAQGMSAEDMQAVAAEYGHESAFVLPSTEGCDWRFRFFVPQHEMEMCGHATVGTLWALRQWGLWTTPTARIETLSGIVEAYWDCAVQRAWISQPAVRTQSLEQPQADRVAAQMGLPAGAWTATNAATSRVKTLMEMPSVAELDALRPDFATMEALCASIDSTGLYPYAWNGTQQDGLRVVHARQFPKSSGYPEDAATGIAAAALWGYLAGEGLLGKGTAAPIAVWQGDAMGSPSEILVAPRLDAQGGMVGCWLSGASVWDAR
ncbi:PhzF family phenazine biosynthesis protein [Cupriavidus pauculus]|uniref:PhzF family phenazine biosynthesis protein n=1 Tax=Cupriavidus pauculus TaxID=82633 RepID=UPI0038575385